MRESTRSDDPASLLRELVPASYADSGAVTLTIYKGGWIIGASGGSGSLYFRGRYYALSTGGLDYGLIFGGSKTVLHDSWFVWVSLGKGKGSRKARG